MDEGVGIACGQCDLFNAMEASVCAECGASLALDPAALPSAELPLSLGDTDSSQEFDSGTPTPLEIVPPVLPPHLMQPVAVDEPEPPTFVGSLDEPEPAPPPRASRPGARRGGRPGARRSSTGGAATPAVPDLDAPSGSLPAAPAPAHVPLVPDLDGPSTSGPALAQPPDPAPRPATLSPARGRGVFARPPEVVPPSARPPGASAALQGPPPDVAPAPPLPLIAPPEASAPPAGRANVAPAPAEGVARQLPARQPAPPPEAPPSHGMPPTPFPAVAPPAPHVVPSPNRIVDAPPSFPAGSGARPLSEEELMDQARNFVCRSCQTSVPPGHKFCGRCGAAVPPEILNLRTKYFSDMQAPGKVKLILIKGEGDDGISYQLQATEHVAGRTQGQILFQHDNWLSPRHANFIYRGNKLIVRDEGSLNGVYLRVRDGAHPITPGDTFLCGEQLLRLDPMGRPNDGPDADQTYFYSSPKRPSGFKIVQILRGGGIGMAHCPRESTATIGREGSDMNFPDDPYISASHAKVEIDASGRITLSDQGSKNGTYLRVKQESELVHGDYLFLGKQLLRVEIT